RRQCHPEGQQRARDRWENLSLAGTRSRRRSPPASGASHLVEIADPSGSPQPSSQTALLLPHHQLSEGPVDQLTGAAGAGELPPPGYELLIKGEGWCVSYTRNTPARFRSQARVENFLTSSHRSGG